MQKIKSSEVIMKRIRNANLNQIDHTFENVDLENEIYTPLDDDIDIVFAKELNKNGGTFVYCESEQELFENIKQLALDRNWHSVFTREKSIQELLNKYAIPFKESQEDFLKSDHGITLCESLVARLGSVLISSQQMSGRSVNFFPNTHIVIANTDQIVPTVKDALSRLFEKYEDRTPSMTTLISGPSRTADIEKTLVMGMHGPRELIVFLI